MLTLPIKKKWFDMIKSGEKKEEYREIKPYYDSRFKNYIPSIPSCGNFKITYDSSFLLTSLYELIEDKIIFKNGYSKNSPQIKCKIKIKKDFGKEEWGAEPGKLYYVLKILSVEEVKNGIVD